MSEDNDKRGQQYGTRPFTVSAIYCDSLEAVITHCFAADAQAACDDVLMRTGGEVIIASVFAGHLTEPDAVVYEVDDENRARSEAEGGRV